MKKKIKLFVTIATLCLSLAMMAFGVFAVISVTYSTTGMVSYEIEDTFVEIETRIYSSSKKYDNAATLKAKSQEFELVTFDVLDALTESGIVEGEETHDFNKVQIKNLDKGNDYVAQSSDYKDTYSSLTTEKAPDDLRVNLKYKTQKADDKGVYTFFVVTKLVNKSEIPLYAYIPTTGADAYVAPENSHCYKMDSEYKELKTLDSELYIVFAMSLDSIITAIDASEFVFPVSVTKDLNAVGGDYETITYNKEHIAKVNLTQLPNKETIYDLGEGDNAYPLTVENVADVLDYSYINFRINDADTTQDLQIQFSLTASFMGETVNVTEAIDDPLCLQGWYLDVFEIMSNLETKAIVDASVVPSDDYSYYTLTIPKENFAGGSLEFCFANMYAIVVSDKMAQYGLSALDFNATSNQLNLKIVKVEPQYSSEISEYSFFNEKLNVNSEIVGDVFEDGENSLNFAYAYENFQIKNIDLQTNSLSLNFECENAIGIIVLEGQKPTVSAMELVAAAELGDCINFFMLEEGRGSCYIPSSAAKEGVVDICCVVYYGEDLSIVGQSANFKISADYKEKLDGLKIKAEPTFEKSTYNISSESIKVSVKQEFAIKSSSYNISYSFLNFSVLNVTSDIIINLSATAKVNGVETDIASNIEISSSNTYYGEIKCIAQTESLSPSTLNGVVVSLNNSATPAVKTITIPASNFSSGQMDFCIAVATSIDDVDDLDDYIDFSVSTQNAALSLKIYTPIYEDKQTIEIGSSDDVKIDFDTLKTNEEILIYARLNMSLTDISTNETGIKITIEHKDLNQMYGAFSALHHSPQKTFTTLLYSLLLGVSAGACIKQDNQITLTLPTSKAKDGQIDFSILLLVTDDAISSSDFEAMGGLAGLGLANVYAKISCEYTTYENIIYDLRTDSDGDMYYAVVGLNQPDSKEIEVPSTWKGLPVKEIDALAFNYIKAEKVIIPSSITKIENGAFGDGWGACDIDHLIVACDPSVLPTQMAIGLDWDFTRAYIRKLTLESYSSGNLPGYLFVYDPLMGVGYATKTIYVPSHVVNIAKAAYGNSTKAEIKAIGS